VVTTLPLPRSEFRPLNALRVDRRSPLRWVIGHVLRHPLLLLGFALGALAAAALNGAIPRLTGLAFDAVLDEVPRAGDLLTLALGILVVVVARGLLDLLANFSIETLGQRLERDARDELYAELLGKSSTFHQRQRVGDVMARAANDVRQLNPMMNPGISLITGSALGILVPLLFVATIDPRLLLAPLAFVVAFGLALRHYMRELGPVTGALRRQFGLVNAGLNETITGIEVVKGAAQEAQERGKFLRAAERYRDHFVAQGKVQARYLPILLLGLASTAGFAHGLYLLGLGAISTGDLVAYVGLLGVLRFPAFISVFTFSLVQLGLAGAARVLELMESESELDENPRGHSAAVDGRLAFEGVSFAYADARAGNQALREVSFQVEPGQTVAIVGQTGSGKSTLTRLVNRSYDPGVGRITLDGIDLRDWQLRVVREQIAVIEQDIFLFSRSVAENIAFGAPGATSTQIETAARAAEAHEFILAFRDGYDTVVGPRGVTLSGGQRQRIAIARALLSNPRLLIIDDATSAIDSATEDAISRAIAAVQRGRTTLLITHRLAQIRRADHILVLARGAVVDQGDHATLLARCKLYQRMFGRA
jgi:ATP-binding cassette, subfamily B, bacterial